MAQKKIEVGIKFIDKRDGVHAVLVQGNGTTKEIAFLFHRLEDEPGIRKAWEKLIAESTLSSIRKALEKTGGKVLEASMEPFTFNDESN